MSIYRHVGLIILCLAISLPAFPPSGKTWQLSWSDEFDGATLDAAKWNHLGDWTRAQGYWYQEDSYLDGSGHLVLRVKKTTDGKYTCGAINSDGKFEQAYGYFESLVKFPTQQGHWCAFWLMTHAQGTIGNEGRDGTEIDIMEKAWLEDRINHALHWDGYAASHQSAGQQEVVAGISTGWHLFGLDWDSICYVFYIDGNEVYRTSAGGVCRVPDYVKLTEEIGNGTAAWGGDISQATLPDSTLVDYVRVYQAVSTIVDTMPSIKPVYTDPIRIVDIQWTGNGTADINAGGAVEGTKCFSFSYTMQSWWAGFGLGFCGGARFDASLYDTLKFYYKGPGNGLYCNLAFAYADTSKNVKSADSYRLNDASGWTTVSIPFSYFTDKGYPLTGISSINFTVGGAQVGVSETFYLDNILLVRRNILPSGINQLRHVSHAKKQGASARILYDMRGRRLVSGDVKYTAQGIVLIKFNGISGRKIVLDLLSR